MHGMIAGFLRRFLSAPVRRFFEGFWAVPVLLSLLGLALAFALNLASRGTFDVFAWPEWLSVDQTGARDTLSVIATAVMTVVSIVFSLTFVALSLTAQQLSPRMLDFVVRERIVQVLIGLGMATFLFSTTALSFGAQSVPWRLAVAALIGLVLGVMTLITVVLFAHRMTKIMRPDEMVARRGDAFLAALRGSSMATPKGSAMTDLRPGGGLDLRTPFAGYVGAVAVQPMTAFARNHGQTLVVDCMEGEFLLENAVLGRLIEPVDSLDPKRTAIDLARLLTISDRREPTGGALYEAQTLAEGAIRALSPGINDPATAMACIYRLFQGLARLADADVVPNTMADEDGTARLIWRPVDLVVLVERTALPIFDHARDDPSMIWQLQSLTEALLARCHRDRDRAAVQSYLSRLRSSPSRDAA
ncbi:MAG: DUF2254 family protein [Geminicoccaceae bacterium]